MSKENLYQEGMHNMLDVEEMDRLKDFTWLSRYADNSLANTALKLTGVIPSHEDPRWRVIYPWNELRVSGGAKENSLQAGYASSNRSKRNRFGKMENSASVIQHARAIQNLNQINKLRDVFLEPIELGDDVFINYQPSTRGERSKDNHGITGCPEALHQFIAWAPTNDDFPHQLNKGNGFIGRIGLNFHKESQKTVITLANVQGSSGCPSLYERYERGAIELFSSMTERVIDFLPKELTRESELRGFIRTHPVKPNEKLYYMTFRRLKIKKYCRD